MDDLEHERLQSGCRAKTCVLFPAASARSIKAD